MSRIAIAIIWLIHFLPLRVIARIGDGIGWLLFWLIPERRKVTRINLGKCLPHKSHEERERIARGHFRAICRAFAQHGIFWWSSPSRIRKVVAVEGLEHLPANSRVVIFAPHFMGQEGGVMRLVVDIRMASMYSRQKDPVFDARLYAGRKRFGGELFPRQAGLRPVVRQIKAGIPFFIMPDLDHGPKGAVFVPFFGVPAAATTGLSFIARVSKAVVVPFVCRMLADGRYLAKFYPAWRDFPSGDDVADARRMMAFVEERIQEMPEQYLWMHKRFKTRPPGEPGFY
jgi:Kdo2-lipid IVA lauroyltransferase/acyltransferase